MHMLAQKLNVGLGALTVSISNAHIYDIHFEQAKEIVNREVTHEAIQFKCPANAFARAEEGDETLVEETFAELKSHISPQEGVGKMSIVL